MKGHGFIYQRKHVMLTASLYWVESPDYLSFNIFSKLVYAEVSKTTSASKRVFHQTVHAQNSMLTKEIHDQGKLNKFFGANLFEHTIYRWSHIRATFSHRFIEYF